MNSIKVITINGETYISVESLTERLGKDNVKLTNNNELYFSDSFTKSNHIINDDFSNNSEVAPPIINNVEVETYWEQAATENKRELFMNTIRPELKKRLGYDFSEILLEKKAKLLCARWYYYKEKGLKYSGPYIIEE